MTRVLVVLTTSITEFSLCISCLLNALYVSVHLIYIYVSQIHICI